MTEVVVDLADLETLVFATGALKTIEGALQSRKQDPFVQPHLNFTEAHGRLATAMRNAIRGTADTVVPWDEPLEAYEQSLLAMIVHNEDDLSILTIVTPGYRLEHPEIDRLLCKGAIIMGQLVKGVIWAGKDRPEIAPDPAGFAIATTARGRNKLAKTTNKDAGMSWHVVLNESGERHVIPIDDLRPHIDVGCCWCGPTDDEGVLVHHSMDKREEIETGKANVS